MLNKTNQENIEIEGNHNKVIAGNDNSTTNIVQSSNSKLTSLFKKLKEKFENDDKITTTSDNLKRYTNRRDTIGLEQKLKDAGKSYLYLDFAWCKQEFHKKLLLYQNYEPAQEIFAFILAIVLEKSRNVINPMIRENKPESEILGKISSEITNPIINLIESEGCYDIMGLSSTEIEGMFHYLTGNCHINWKL
jgi:hypothetical protein